MKGTFTFTTVFIIVYIRYVLCTIVSHYRTPTIMFGVKTLKGRKLESGTRTAEQLSE